MSRENIAEIIMATPLFKGLDASVSHKAAQSAQVLEFAAGEAVFTEGGSVPGLGVLISGKAEVHKTAGGKKVFMSLLEPGAMLGAAGLFQNGAATVTEVIAAKPCTLAFIGEEELKELMGENIDLAFNYMRYLTGRIRFLTSRIESIASPNASEKLMNYLALNSVDDRLTLPMGYTALADALCIGRASLYRAMDAMENDGRIKREGRTIYILNHREEPK